MKNTMKLIRNYPITSVVVLATLILFAIPLIYALFISICVVITMYLLAKLFGVK
jgi:hypothetical protein|tara:strand:+ start:321 stop:482 length:162 start_codon:yes stop_codon:yes gene_type:complete